mmetsp:Transcript_121/g.211  ORF Transcript_121/g.211 Transcript_121/m.211 type:complete len:537 (-) Transcript_121:3610-5220(-)
MLGDWAGSHGENDGGVSIEKVFERYDRDRSGDIDSSELAVVLADLGVEVTDAALKEAFQLLDANGDGRISFEEFGRWWRRDEVQYTIKRSDEILSLATGDDGSVGSGRSNQKEPVASRRRPGSRGHLRTIPEDTSLHSTGIRGSAINTNAARPRSASTVRGSANSAANAATATRRIRSVGVPIVSYRGSKSQCEVAGLTPNRLYHFRLRYVGSRSSSMLSNPLVIMTAPLPPSVPVLIDVSASSARIKWYPSDFGAFKFLLQLRLRSSSTDEVWSNMYNGLDNTWTTTTLTPDCSYEVRCYCANFQGHLSEPSESMIFNTLSRKDGFAQTAGWTARTISQKFSIECTGDVCVGDMVLITERLFVSHGEAFDGSVLTRSGQHSTTATARPRSAGRATTTSSRQGLATVSVSSAQSTTTAKTAGVVSITAEHGEFIGERTIAACVCRDNSRSLRERNGQLSSTGAGRQRLLWLEVVWQRGSCEACKPFEPRPGEVLERRQEHLEQFEVFRTEWRQEKLRRPLLQEWASLQECFQPADC